MKKINLYFVFVFLGIIILNSCQKEPTAAFTASKVCSSPNESILFTNSSTDGDHYSWEFGDGSTSNEKNPSHIFTNAGDYLVTLTASSKNGKKTNSVSLKISVGLSPGCSFTYTPKFPKPNEIVQFSDKSSNSPTSWLWNFGDGETSTSKNPSHTYTSENTYTVSLTATNNFGQASQNVNIVVSSQTPEPPDAIFTYTNNGNLSISFHDQSTGNPTSWLWTFGDGSTSTIQNPTHQYSQLGSYLVTLKVTNIAGSDQTSQTINLADYSFLVGAYSVLDYAGGYYSNYSDNITAGSSFDKFWTGKFGNYINAVVYFLVSGTTIDVPSQIVRCGQPPYDVDHTFVGSGTYAHNGSDVTINITYNDHSTLGNWDGCTGTYTKLEEKVKINDQDTKDKTWYLLQQLKK